MTSHLENALIIINGVLFYLETLDENGENLVSRTKLYRAQYYTRQMTWMKYNAYLFLVTFPPSIVKLFYEYMEGDEYDLLYCESYHCGVPIMPYDIPASGIIIINDQIRYINN